MVGFEARSERDSFWPMEVAAILTMALLTMGVLILTVALLTMGILTNLLADGGGGECGGACARACVGPAAAGVA